MAAPRISAGSGVRPPAAVAVLRGKVLRAWRSYAGLTMAELARRIPTRPSAVSMWEGGRRGSRSAQLETVAAIADRLGLPEPERRSLLGMWRAAGSVTDGLPRRRWIRNFPPPSQVAWLWLRPEPGASSIDGSIWWGEPFQGRVSAGVSPAGLFIRLPTTVSFPPLEFMSSRPVWVDVGVGQVPELVAATMGARAMDGVDLLVGGTAPYGITRTSAAGFSRELAVFRQTLTELGISWASVRPDGWVDSPTRSTYGPHELTVRNDGRPPTADEQGAPLPQLLIGPTEARRVRESRGLSRRRATAGAGATDPDAPISAKSLVAMEAQGVLPPSRFAVPRLDLQYDLDGHLGLDRVFDSSTAARGSGPPWRLEVPAFWCGPVWIHVAGAGGPTVLTLTWAGWRRGQHVHSGTVLSMRRAPTWSTGLSVDVDGRWRVVAGLGCCPSALDISRGWWPTTTEAAKSLFLQDLRSLRSAR